MGHPQIDLPDFSDPANWTDEMREQFDHTVRHHAQQQAVSSAVHDALGIHGAPDTMVAQADDWFDMLNERLSEADLKTLWTVILSIMSKGKSGVVQAGIYAGAIEHALRVRFDYDHMRDDYRPQMPDDPAGLFGDGGED
jgi:hypothetical protein